MTKFCQIFFCLLLMIGCSIFCAAQTNFNIDFNKKISAKTDLTHLNLVQKIFPDAKTDDKNPLIAYTSRKIEIRNLLTQKADKLFHSELKGDLEIGIIADEKTVNGTENLIWLLIHAQEKGSDCETCGNAFLTVFRVKENTVELIDAASVKTNSFTFIDDSLKIALKHQAIIIYNQTQLNDGAHTYSIIDVTKNRFRIILKDFEVRRTYRCDQGVEESIKMRVLRNLTNGYRNLEILIKTESSEPDLSGDSITRFRGRFRYVFVWEPFTQNYKAIINPDKKRSSVYKKYRPCVIQ